MQKLTRLRSLEFFGLCCLLLVATGTAAWPEQAGTQPQDEEFARLVREWTTRPEFLSPLVDHLPEVDGVPSPKDVIGYHVGAPKELTYYADILRYYRALAEATPRVRVMPIGRTHEGRENVIVFVGSDESMENLERHRDRLARLADPRNLTEDEAYEIIAQAKPIYHLIGGLHPLESGAPLMLMELAYRLAVEDSPVINSIRENVIVTITPSGEPDGLDRVADWVYAYRLDETTDEEPDAGGPPYWGKYVYHDDNRDINVSQNDMRDLLEWYLEWHPPIMHDLHQSIPFLYTYSGNAPQNRNLDPIVFGEMPWLANFEMAQMTKYGMPGVWTHAFMDAWGVGYFASMSPNHNGMLRMYETFGNGTSATKTRTVASTDNPGRYEGREWYRPLPASDYGEVEWSMRNTVNYVETAVLSGLQLVAEFPDVVLENFYLKSLHSMEAGREEAPHGYVIPSEQKDMTRVTFMVNVLRRQGIEIGRATEEVSVEEGTFPADSYVIKLDQPYGRLAKSLLEKQTYPDPDLRTYDDSGWTIGWMVHAEVVEIDDESILDLPVEPVGTVNLTGTVRGASGVAMAVANYGSNHLVTLRYRLRDLRVQAAEQAFTAEGVEFPPGSLVIDLQGGGALARAREAVVALGQTAAVLSSPPGVPMHEVDLPRFAVYSTWSNTQPVGWVRHALDEFEVSYDLIYKERVRAGRLRDDYDLILIPNQGRTAKDLVFGRDPLPGKTLAYKKNDRFKTFGVYGESDDITGGMGLVGAEEIRKFVDDGGVLATYGAATTFPPEFGITRAIDAQRPPSSFYAPGPIVEAEIVKPSHPIFYGYDKTTIPIRYANGPILQVPERDREKQVLMRYADKDDLAMSGHMRGSGEVKGRPAIVEVPVGKGKVLLFATNPCYRWQNWGEFKMMFNTIMHFNDLDVAPSAEPTEAAASP